MNTFILTVLLFIPVAIVILIIYAYCKHHDRKVLLSYIDKMYEIETLLAEKTNKGKSNTAYYDWCIDPRIGEEKITQYDAKVYVDTYLKYYSTSKEFDTIKTVGEMLWN